jgi:Ca2+/Na+ antiporter
MNDASGPKAAAVLLMLAAAGWYLASRAAAEALAASSLSPGRRAVGMSIPTAVLAILAIVMGWPEVATGIVFASSVAGLTLVLGVITISANPNVVSRPRRIWGFVMPAAMIALLLGLRAGIGWVQVGALLVEGMALGLLWNERQPAPSVSGASPPAHAVPATERPAIGMRAAVLIAAILAAAVGSWAALRAVDRISSDFYNLNRGMVTALMLAPAIVLPMIGTGTQSAHVGDYDHAVTTQVGVVLINLCAILPLVAVLWMTRPTWGAAFVDPPPAALVSTASATQSSYTTSPASTTSTTSTAPSTTSESEPHSAFQPPRELPYPMAVWRVDTVLLVALGMLLLPVSLGKWTIGMIEGYALLLVYAIYLALSALVVR